MKTRITSAAAALILGVASISSAMAGERPSRYTSSESKVQTTGSIDAIPQTRSPFSCPMSSAAEGNANQQAFPV